MRILNLHQRELPVPADRVGALIDSLASTRDALWPTMAWPPMKLDRPLGVGASGGHGPIRYVVEEYLPGRSVRFRFTAPRGFDGTHSFDCISETGQPTVLRHTLAMTAHGLAILSWPLAFRPLHDALLEDALAQAEAALALDSPVCQWSLWVKVLRWAISGGKARPQAFSRPNSRAPGAH